MKKTILFILCTILVAALVLGLSACSGKHPETAESSDPGGTETLADQEKSPEDPESLDEKTMTANPALLEEGQFLFFRENPIITDKGDYYEIEEVCIAGSGDFKFEPSMFEGKEVGDLLHLPNGDFTLENITDLDGVTQFDVSNEYFMHYFVLDGDVIYAVGIGEHLVLENKYAGPLRFSKNCRYEIQESLDEDPIPTTLQEQIEDKEYPWEYGAFLYIDELDSENNISAVSDMVLP